MFFRRPRRVRTKSINRQVAALEPRLLLSGVTSGIQIDSQAPTVFVDTDEFSLLSVQDDDSTRIFHSDGTQQGTILLVDVAGVVATTDVIGEVNGKLIFRAVDSGQLWATDGTANGTVQIADLSFDSAFAESHLFQGQLYFAADGGDGVELFQTDGTSAGTRQVADINSGQIEPAGSTFSFDAIAGAVSYDVRLLQYEIDHNAGNYGSRGDLILGFQQGVSGTTVTFDHAAPTDANSRGDEAYLRLQVTPNLSDGSQGEPVIVPVQLQHGMDNRSSHPSQFVEFNNELWFAAETPDAGREWWKTDGTSAGTELALDVIPGQASSYPVKPVLFDDELFFGSFGNQDLYRTDGTSAVTVSAGYGVSHLSTVARGMPLRSRAELLVGSYPIAVLNERLIVQQGSGGGDDGTFHRLVSFDSATSAARDLGAVGRIGVVFPLGGTGYFDGFTEVNNHLVFRQMYYTPSSSAPFPRGSLLSTDGISSVVLATNQSASYLKTIRVPEILESMGDVVDGELRFPVSYIESGIGDEINRTGAVRTDGTVAGTELYVSSVFDRFGSGPSWVSDYAVVGDTTFEQRARRLAGTSRFVDLYQIDPDGQEFLLEEDFLQAPFVQFNDQLFLQRAANGGEELAFIQPRDYLAPLTITSGAGSTTDTTPTLTWTDGGNDVVRYDLFINSTNDRQTPVFRNQNLTTTELTLTDALEKGTYEVWVRAIYSGGQATRWGSPASLTISDDGGPVTRPIITGPGGFAITKRPRISWTAVTDATSYEVWISGPYDTNPILRADGIAETSFVPSIDLPEGTVQVWVRATTPDGLSRWSPVFRFYYPRQAITFTMDPIQPTSHPLIQWSANDDVQQWDLYIRQVGQSSAIYRRTTLTGTQHVVEDALPDGHYSVWLRATFQDGSKSFWGRPQSLEVDSDHLPEATSTYSDENDQQLIVRWDYLVDDVQSFDVRLIDDRGSEPFLINVGDSNAVARRELVYRGELPSGTYTVEVRARLNDGTITEYGAAVSHVVPVRRPEMESPVFQQTQSPTLRWSQTSTDATYQLTIRDQQTQEVVYERQSLTSASHTLEEPILYGNYEVLLVTTDDQGSLSPVGWSELRLQDSDPTFRQSQPVVTLENGVASWNEIDGAVRYQIQVNRPVNGGWGVTLRYEQISERFYDVAEEFGAGEYIFWVQAIHSNGSRSLWSELVHVNVD